MSDFPPYLGTRSRKRIAEGESESETAYKRRKTEPKTNLWVSGTDIRNYLTNDHLVDWLKLTKGSKPKTANSPSFLNYITQKGQEFETELVRYLQEAKIPIETVSEQITNDTCRETIRLMRLGVPVIHSAPFKNELDHTHGVIDFLVRSDYLHRLVSDVPIVENGTHYVVVDVKFSTLPLRADGIHLLNSGRYPAYKGQLRIYTEAIGLIQNYTPRYAYVLGRRYSYTCKDEKFSSLDCLNRLGVVDYQGVDLQFVGKTRDAIKWVRDVRAHGAEWSLFPPTREELYPNMCVDSNEWNAEKSEIAERLGDITQIWYCGVKQRTNALKKGICSWRDERCTSKAIGMNGMRASTVDAIMNINRQSVDKIRPKKIRTNLCGWRDSGEEAFVDFETFCDVFASLEELPMQPKTDSIFMIGVWFKGEYKNFTVRDASKEEEFRIMDEFVQFIKNQKSVVKLWHWYADESIWTKAENRQMDLACASGDVERADHIVDNWKLHTWADLCSIFRAEPIVIKDCFKFGLKEIAKAMYKHGLISTRIDSECKSGMDASIRAWKVFNETYLENPLNEPVIQDIAKYNEFDVKVLWDILNAIRKL